MSTYIFLNLKRFDIPKSRDGINNLAPIGQWARHIVTSVEAGLKELRQLDGAWVFPIFFPEAHLLSASQSKDAKATHPIALGCQSVHNCDTQAGKNLGAFTSSLTANAACELGCSWTIIGHSEERAKLLAILAKAKIDYDQGQIAIHAILNEQIMMAQRAGLKVLYCIGEHDFEVERRAEVLNRQISEALRGVDATKLVLAYEPIWAIGPGKKPPTAEQIAQTATLIKQLYSAPLVYGGGLKKENAQSLGAIKELDGGLIALTRFTGEIGFYPEEYVEIVDLYSRGATV